MPLVTRAKAAEGKPNLHVRMCRDVGQLLGLLCELNALERAAIESDSLVGEAWQVGLVESTPA